MDQTERTSAPSSAHSPGTIAHSSLLSRRRKSLPTRSYAARKKSATVDSASPEVISSLISSLSTISVPLQSHFDNVPRIESDIVPPSPSFLRTEFPSLPPPPSAHGSNFGVTYGTLKSPGEPPESPYLHPDNAAAAPVVRMARGPSSSKAKTTFDPPPSPIRPTSKSSYTSAKKLYKDAAFGMISAEPIPPASAAPSIASSSSEGRKSLKGALGLLRRNSRGSVNDKEGKADRLHRTSSHSDNLKHNVAQNRGSLRSMHSMAGVIEEQRPVNVGAETRTATTVSAPPSRERQSLYSLREFAANGPGEGVESGWAIPARDSSLRHSFCASPKQKRTARHNRYSSIGSRETKVDSGVFGTSNNDADQVTKRIQELKDQQQKIKTELETDNTPDKSVLKMKDSNEALEAKETPIKPAASPQKPSEARHELSSPPTTTMVIEESAPTPAVQTGKNSRPTPRTGVPPPLKNAQSQPPSTRQSLDKLDQKDKLRSRQSLEKSTSTKGHKRSPSGPTSPGLMSIGDDRPSSVDSVDIGVSDYVSSPKLTQKIPHPTTGRMIAFSDVGDPKGHVVLCCLGMGLTRYLMAFYDELAQTLKLRLITLDRPGVGESGPYLDETGTPLGWPDDVAIVCNHLKVTKFSILAHSAGAIYALATALRIPQHIRGRIHLLAPWIPPSQLSSIGSQKEPVPSNAVPYSQRILRALPTSILKVANSSFMSATSASVTSSLPKSPRRNRRRATMKETSSNAAPTKMNGSQRAQSKMRQQGDDLKSLEDLRPPSNYEEPSLDATIFKETDLAAAETEDRERQIDYDNRLTHKIWELATTNANPAVDLLICLERRQTIGFRYADITRAVVIHHGTKDTRVPVDNVRWLGRTMRRCEVRILEDEGHGLMASAAVMGNVLMEIAKEWEDWMILVQGKRKATAGSRSGIAQRV